MDELGSRVYLRIDGRVRHMTWLGPGVMQIELGAPIAAATPARKGVLPSTDAVPGGAGE
jgi:hypothetical protein